MYRKSLEAPVRGRAVYDCQSRGVTPLMTIDCLQNFTPSCETMSTPGYDSYNFHLEYSRTPNRPHTPQLDATRSAYTAAFTPTRAAATDAMAIKSCSSTPKDSPKLPQTNDLSPQSELMSPTSSHVSPLEESCSPSPINESTAFSVGVDLAQDSASIYSQDEGHSQSRSGAVSPVSSHSSGSTCDTCSSSQCSSSSSTSHS